MGRKSKSKSSSSGKSVARRYELVEGLKIHYRVYGRGPSVLLLIHGAVGGYPARRAIRETL